MVDVGLARVTPHRKVRKAEHQRMFSNTAMSHHVFLHITPTKDLVLKQKQKTTHTHRGWDKVLHSKCLQGQKLYSNVTKRALPAINFILDLEGTFFWRKSKSEKRLVKIYV